MSNLEDVFKDDTPQILDLDTLLQDDEVDVKAVNYNSEDYKPANLDIPHFSISKLEFMKALKISTILSQGAGKDITTKSVGMQVVNGKLKIFLTNFEMYATKEVDIMNTENVLEDYIVVNLGIVQNLMGLCKPILTIMKKEDGYYFKVFDDGDMYLETIEVAKEHLVIKDSSQYTGNGTLGTEEFITAIKGLYPVAASAITPAQRRLFIAKTEITALYLYCVARYKCKTSMPTFDLPLSAVKILTLLCSSDSTAELKVKKYKNFVMIKGTNFEFSFVTTKYKPQDVLLTNMTQILDEKESVVDSGKLLRPLVASSSLIYSTSRSEFNYDAEGRVNCVLKTKRKDQSFIVGENSENKPLQSSISIQSNMLRSVLSIFPKDVLLSFYLSPKGVGMSDNSFEAVLYTESAGES